MASPENRVDPDQLASDPDQLTSLENSVDLDQLASEEAS